MRSEPSSQLGSNRKILLGLLACALILGSTVPALAARSKPKSSGPIEVETLRIGLSSAAQGNLFKLGKWTPLWVQLRAGTARFEGVIEVVVPDDDGTPTIVRQVIDVPAASSTRLTSYARPGTNNPDFLLRIYDRGGRRVGEVSGDALVKPDALPPDETVLLALGNPQGVELIPKLPGFSAEKNQPGSRPLTIARLDLLAAGLPGRWLGYDAVDAVGARHQ